MVEKKTSSSAKRKKVKRVVKAGVVHVHATFNNTIITITDLLGNVLSWSTAGKEGFKGSRKSTPFAAQVASKNAAEKAAPYGLQEVAVKVRGPGPGREASIRPLSEFFKVTVIEDVTGIPHNGCRAEKERRV